MALRTSRREELWWTPLFSMLKTPLARCVVDVPSARAVSRWQKAHFSLCLKNSHGEHTKAAPIQRTPPAADWVNVTQVQSPRGSRQQKTAPTLLEMRASHTPKSSTKKNTLHSFRHSLPQGSPKVPLRAGVLHESLDPFPSVFKRLGTRVQRRHRAREIWSDARAVARRTGNGRLSIGGPLA